MWAQPEAMLSQKGAQTTSADVALLESFRAGDDSAFDALYARHYGKVHRILVSLVGDEAEDLAQETFLRLYKRPPTAPDTEIAAWLYRVATNLGRNALRRQGRWQRYRDLLGSVTRGRGWRGPAQDAQQIVEERDQRRLVRQVLATLSERQATTLVLRYGGLSYREVAQVLGVTPNSVGTMLARAERAFERAYEVRRLAGGER